jgi:hypothetical protein
MQQIHEVRLPQRSNFVYAFVCLCLCVFMCLSLSLSLAADCGSSATSGLCGALRFPFQH